MKTAVSGQLGRVGFLQGSVEASRNVLSIQRQSFLLWGSELENTHRGRQVREVDRVRTVGPWGVQYPTVRWPAQLRVAISPHFSRG